MLTDILIIVATGILLVMGCFIEVLIWAATYAVRRTARPGPRLFRLQQLHHPRLWRRPAGAPVALLGPITALNGILLISWSTALIFEILRRSVHYSEKR